MPTLDPADPLNWAPWRKVACIVSVSLYAFVSNFVSASMAPALVVWNIEFPQDPRELAQLMQLVAVSTYSAIAKQKKKKWVIAVS